MTRSLKDQDIFVEQIKLLAKQVPSMVWIVLLTTLIITLVLMGKVENWLPLFLLTGILLLSGARVWHYKRLKNEEITIDNVNFHSVVFVGFSFIGGSIWGIFSYFIPLAPDPFLLILTVCLLCGLIGGSMSYLSAYETTFFAYAIP